MRACGSLVLLLSATAVSAQRSTAPLAPDFPDIAFTVGYRSYAADFFRALIGGAAPVFETPAQPFGFVDAAFSAGYVRPAAEVFQELLSSSREGFETPRAETQGQSEERAPVVGAADPDREQRPLRAGKD